MPIPTPIGVGPRYHPPAVHARCERAPTQRMHLELFANGRVIIIPARIGCWTCDPTGVVHFRPPSTLGDFFRVWRQRLLPDRLLSFEGGVRVYRNGRRVRGDPGDFPLRGGDEVVVEVGPYIPPHRSYLFPRAH